MRSIGVHYRLSITAVALLLSQAASAGPDVPDPIAAVAPRIDALIENEMEERHIVGLSIAIVRGNKTVYAKGFGFADLEKRIPAGEETIYRMGSLSKVFTAVAVMQLVEEGRIDPDAPIETYLPAFDIRHRFDDRTPITVRRLLTHHAGFPTDLMAGADTVAPESLDALIEQLSREYTAQPVGKVFQYSNIGYAVLGKIIEAVSGRPFEQYMKERIFQPLGMAESAFSPNEKIHQRLATGYLRGKPAPQYAVREKPAAGLYASVSDVARFLRTILSVKAADRTAVLKKRSVEEMLSKQNTDTPLDLDLSCGLGWQLTHRLSNELNAGPMAWHDGRLWHFFSSMAILPEHSLGVVVAANTDTANSSVSKIAKGILRKILWQTSGVERLPFEKPQEEVHADAETLQRLAGHYDTAGGPVEIQLNDGYLEWRDRGKSAPFRLVPLSDGSFGVRAFLNSILTYQSPYLEKLNIRFVPVENETVLATVENGIRIPLGRKIRPASIPGRWHRALGFYANPTPENDFVAVKQLELKEENGFLIADIRIGGAYTQEMKMTVSLSPGNENTAFVDGVGRYRGDAVTLLSDGKSAQLRFQGYLLKKQPRQPRLPRSVYLGRAPRR